MDAQDIPSVAGLPERGSFTANTTYTLEAIAFGTPVINDVAPIARNNRTMLPLCFVAENLGATSEWEQATQRVVITAN